MSELKHQLMLNKERSWVPCYLKYEADKVIAHNKYRRCLAMARWCNRMFSSTFGKERYWQKWNRRWLELAEKFKHNKEVSDGRKYV